MEHGKVQIKQKFAKRGEREGERATQRRDSGACRQYEFRRLNSFTLLRWDVIVPVYLFQTSSHTCARAHTRTVTLNPVLSGCGKTE